MQSPPSKKRRKRRRRKSSFNRSFGGDVKEREEEISVASAGATQCSATSQIQLERMALPIHGVRKKLLAEIRKNACSIVMGETGSGKTTQIPQYLFRAGVMRDGLIACTQPRRVAAMTVAKRVASEMGVVLGELVGYSVRFEDCSSDGTRIKYMTDGMLLREAMGDPLLSRYTIILLDEAHERTIQTDILFGVVKSAQISRKAQKHSDLKIIVMSATADVDQASKYFNNAPVLYVEGRPHPVQVNFSTEPQTDYQFAALVTIFQLHKEHPAGQDILVFLTGQEEIETMMKSVRDVCADLPATLPKLHVCALYAAMPTYSQLAAFAPTPAGSRKVILSTNIAETSVTIPGVKFVVDTGVVKAKVYKPGVGVDMLKVVPISKAQAWQRTGRAGRESSGTCYRLYTEEDFDARPQQAIPEIRRCNFTSIMLQLLAMGLKDVEKFDFVDRPVEGAIVNAEKVLTLLRAVKRKGGQRLKLMKVGRKLADFPLEPALAHVILASEQLECSEEVLSIVSMLSVDTVTWTPQAKKEEAQAARNKFSSSEGDHITLLNIFRAANRQNRSKKWFRENYLHARNIEMAAKIRKQLRTLCERHSMTLKSCGQDMAPIRKCFANSMFMNTAELQQDGKYVAFATKQPISIHPSSVLFNSKPLYVVFNELVHTTKSFMRNLVVVEPEWLYEAAPNFFRRQLKGTH